MYVLRRLGVDRQSCHATLRASSELQGQSSLSLIENILSLSLAILAPVVPKTPVRDSATGLLLFLFNQAS